MSRIGCALLLVCLLSLPAFLRAETASLASASGWAARAALIAPADTGPARAGTASLFVDQQKTGFFAPLAPRPRAGAPRLLGPHSSGLSGDQILALRRIIGYAESRRDGYDAVQHGARIRPSKRPTEMTIAEIDAWIDATPGQPHAIGKYQFIPKTLRRLVRLLDIPATTRFEPRVQDLLADQLLREAGIQRAVRGEIGRHMFMNNLARIWAGLPTSNGRSYYHGYAGNRATKTWASFDAQMREIFPG